MKLKTLVVTAAVALGAITVAAPASADPLPSGCDVHLETIVGGVCVPTP